MARNKIKVLHQSPIGFTIVELVVASAIMALVVLGIAVTMRWSSLVSTNARKEMATSRLLQDIFTRLRAIYFYDVYDLDTSQPNFGLSFGSGHSTSYPLNSQKAIQSLHSDVVAAGMTHFTVKVEFMRRSLTGSASGGAYNLVPVNIGGITPTPGSLGMPGPKTCDIFDSKVCYQDFNGDGDFFEGPVFALSQPSEFPDTHIKLVTVSIFDNRGQIVRKESQLISQEGLSGRQYSAQQSDYLVILNTPPPESILYSTTSAFLRDAWTLPVLNPFSGSVVSPVWGDNLSVNGFTEPNATVDFKIGGLTPAFFSDAAGTFSGVVTNAGAALTEGWNSIQAQATKPGGYSSPWLSHTVLFDLSPPKIEFPIPAPSVTVPTLRPYIEAVFSDQSISGTTTVSGLGRSPNCYLRRDDDGFTASDVVPCVCDPLTGRIVFSDSEHSTLLPTKKLEDGHNYFVLIESEDRALYRATASWMFRAELYPDTSIPPVIETTSVFPPHNGAHTSFANATIHVAFLDRATAPFMNSVDPMSFSLCLDDVLRVGKALPDGEPDDNDYNMGSFFDAKTQIFHFTPASPLPSGNHWIDVFVRDWSGTPLDVADRGGLDTGSCDGQPSVRWRFTIP